MNFLPSEQTENQKKGLLHFITTGAINLSEPCDCGSHIRHNNGGNYHDIQEFTMDAGKCFTRFTSTSEYSEWSDWSEISFSDAMEQIAKLIAEWGF